MRRADFIFRIGQVIRAVEASTGLDTVDPVGREILRFIAEAGANGEAPIVTDVVSKTKLGTAPRIYARLAELERGGWIVPQADPVDGRVKRLLLAPPAERAFRKMSKEIARLSGESRYAMI